MNPNPWLRCLLIFAIGLFPSVHAGPLQRVPNTTLQLPEAPPELTFTWTNAFNSMNFTNPVCIASPPGETNRIFIVEKQGRIVVITNLASPTRSIFLDVRSSIFGAGETSYSDEQGMFSMAFHPGYATNRYFYVWYTGTNIVTSQGTNRHDVLSRFQTSSTNANVALTNETRFLTQYDEANNHNGGDLHFGPDGYLYLTIGDEGMHFGVYNNCQRIDKDFFATMLRLDVDKRPANLEPNPHPAIKLDGSGHAFYSVPVDNPFVHTSLGGDWNGIFNGSVIADLTKVRTEFWVVGLRNPFRFSFSPIDGTLYEGDVGEQAREEVNIIERGKNYGWNWYEGELLTTGLAGWPTNPVPPGGVPAGFTNTLPLHSYTQGSASETWAIIGGYVYAGQRLSQLYGAYIFGDYGQGYVWALRHEGSNVTDVSLLFRDDFNANGTAAITSFGVDPSNGDILYCDAYNGRNGRVKRIIAATNSNPNALPIPATLAATGAFTDLATLTPQPGVVPYALNVPFWSDNAIKSRWFSLPDTNLTVDFSPDSNWSFPTGAVWIKHFELELTNGAAASRKRLETRFIVKNEAGVYGVTYRWGGSLTNATLVPEEGLDESFVINDGGTLRTQIWHYPSRVECLLCHTEQGGFALGFNTPQLNRDSSYNGTNANQILALSDAGYFTAAVNGIHALPALAAATNGAVSLEYRVRSYFAANCSQCHQGNGAALWDARITTRTADAGIVDGALLNDLGNPNNRVVKSGSLTNSVLFTRISQSGGLRMPPIGSTMLDTQAMAMVGAWITNALPDYQTFAQWQSVQSWPNGPDADPTADPDGDRAVNYLEYLTGTDPLSGTNLWQIGIQRSGADVQIIFPQIANRLFEVESAGDLTAPVSWQPLDAIGNEPFFSSSNFTKTILISPATDAARYYRVRVSEP